MSESINEILRKAEAEYSFNEIRDGLVEVYERYLDGNSIESPENQLRSVAQYVSDHFESFLENRIELSSWEYPRDKANAHYQSSEKGNNIRLGTISINFENDGSITVASGWHMINHHFSLTGDGEIKSIEI